MASGPREYPDRPRPTRCTRRRRRSARDPQPVGKSLERLRPDLLVVYADRFEGFAAVIAGTQMGIPTAHIEGGDYTRGRGARRLRAARDDEARPPALHHERGGSERIRRLGEEPWRVYTVGSPSIDLIADGSYATPRGAARSLWPRCGRGRSSCSPSTRSRTEVGEAVGQIQPSLAASRRWRREGVQVS